MQKLIEIIQKLIREKFTGKLVVDFFKGGIANAETNVKDKVI